MAFGNAHSRFCLFSAKLGHHFIVDFLSAHPRVIQRKPETIRGVGVGILLQLVALAEEMGVPCVWGEATVHSAPFYERTLDVKKYSTISSLETAFCSTVANFSESATERLPEGTRWAKFQP